MSDVKDPAIKLFGKTIPLAETPVPSFGSHSPPPYPDPAPDENINRDRSSSPAASDSIGGGGGQDDDEGPSGGRQTDVEQEGGSHTSISQETINPNENSPDNPKTTAADNESPESKTSKTEEQGNTSNSQEKTIKKPDKILPCPRCNSMETKFCYYNNYNVNQPRHFCKNCQRYWTAGGTMRNVPVGAGRRKNKNSASHYRHITVSEALQDARVDIPNGTHCPTLRPNGTVLTFGSDSPPCESMASVLIAEKNMQNCARDVFHKPDDLKYPIPCKGGENRDDHSSGCSITPTKLEDDDGKNGSEDVSMQNFQSFPPQVPLFSGPPWPYPLNLAQWVPPPGFCPPGFPMPFYPALPYWGCTVQAPWSVPWVNLPPALSTGHKSPTLGKHSRDESPVTPTDSGEEEKHIENSSEKSLWIPKTLRIDNPGEAAKSSSLWATLGIKHENCHLARGGGGGLFKAFQLKADEKSGSSETSLVLQANPAALSRSQNFQESS